MRGAWCVIHEGKPSGTRHPYPVMRISSAQGAEAALYTDGSRKNGNTEIAGTVS